MAGADVGGGGGGSHKKHGKKKAKKRVSIRIDMTPMVDVAFLLLTFFMLTTVFRKPNTLEINLPPDNKTEIKMAESNLLTIRCDEHMNLYWNIGFEIPHKLSFADLRKFLQERQKENSKYVVLIKIDRKSKYHAMIDIIDELNLANLGRYSMAPMTDIDKKEMSKATI
jgi:biopolymer transport protein ExbD